MALADTANLLVKLSLGGNFLSQIGKATTGLNKFDTQLGKTESRAFRAGQQIGTGIRNAGRLAAVGVGFLVSQVGLGLQSLIELEQATAQTNAVIKSTGGIAGVTAEEVQRLSEKFESLNATIGDEFITSAQNMLLTFTNIRGKGFEPALEAVLNMNTALGKGPEGLQSTAIQVGKALQDPIKGVATLRRAGVQLNEQQEEQIKTLVKQNRLYDAQAIIIDELDRQFGGSFLGQGNTTAGKIAKFTDSIDDLQRALAKALLPALGNVADALSSTLQDPGVIKGVEDFGKSLANLISPENLAEGGRILREVFNVAREAAPGIAAAAQVMGQVVGTAVKMFNSLPKEIQQIAIAGLAINKLTGGLVTNLAGGLISSVLKQLVSGVVNVTGATVIVNGAVGPGGVPVVPGGGKTNPLALLPAATIAGALVLAAAPIGQAFASALPAELKGPGGRGESESQRRIQEGRQAEARQIASRPAQTGGRSLEDRDALSKITAAQQVTSSAALALQRAGERQSAALSNLKLQAPVVNVSTTVNVTAGSVTKAITINRRYSPHTPSRSGVGFNRPL